MYKIPLLGYFIDDVGKQMFPARSKFLILFLLMLYPLLLVASDDAFSDHINARERENYGSYTQAAPHKAQVVPQARIGVM